METCRSHTRRLVAAATELPPNANAPGGDEPTLPRAARRLAAIELSALGALGAGNGAGANADLAIDLATAVPRWLEAIADRMAASLSPMLATAERAWDQAGHVRLLDGALRAELGDLLTAARLASDTGLGLLCRLALDATLGWVELFERRLATLLRLRMRQGAPLLVDGRPFLDVEPVVRQLATQLRAVRSAA